MQEILSLVKKVWRSQQKIPIMIYLVGTVQSYTKVLGGMKGVIRATLMACIIMVHTGHTLMASTGIRGKSITIP